MKKITLLLFVFLMSWQINAQVTTFANPDTGSYSAYQIVYNNNIHFTYRSNSTNKLAKLVGSTVSIIPNPDTGSGQNGKGIVYNGNMYYQYITATSSGRLYKYDGTSATLINNPDSGIGVQGEFIVFNNNLYFGYINSSGKTQLAKFDGTTITLIANPNTGNVKDVFVEYDSNLYFKYQDTSGKNVLAKFDGASVSLIANPDTGQGFFNSPVVYNNNLYFCYNNSSSKYNLAKFDGTTINLYTNPDTGNGFINTNPIILNNSLYLKYSNDSSQQQLAQFDGTAFILFANPNSNRGYSGISVILNNNLYFYCQGVPINNLAKFDGTSISVLANPSTGSGMTFAKPYIFQDKIYYVYTKADNKYVLAETDGTTTNLIANPSATAVGINPGTDFSILNDKLYFKYDISGGFMGGISVLGQYSPPCNTAAPSALPQTFCGNATVANLVATGTGTFNWYDVATGGTALASTTVLSTGTYYVTQTINGCESPRRSVRISTTNNALNFNGSINNVVNLSNTINTTFSSDFTIEAKIYSTNFGTSIKTIINSISGSNGIAFYVNNWQTSDKKLVAEIGQNVKIQSSVSLEENKWYYVALSRTGNLTKLYINGIEVASQTISFTNELNFPTFIGAFNSDGSYIFNGTIDNVKIWNRPLTIPELVSSINSENLATITGLVSSYNFNQGIANANNTSETTLIDTFGTNNGTLVNFTLNGTTSNWVAGDNFAPIATAQSFCDSATVANLVATGANLKWYDVATGGMALASTTALTTGMYYVSQTVGECEGSRKVVNVTINTIPTAPTSYNQFKCDSGTVSQLNATGQNLQWYDGNNNLLAGTTALVAGNYYVTQTVNGCESNKKMITLQIFPTENFTENQTACDSFTWAQNNQTYTSSGTYTNIGYCDTHTLNLTITPSSTNTTTVTACNSYTWAENGETYTSSGTYSNVTGCTTEELVLTITPSTTTTTITSSCGPTFWSANNQLYSQSGTYTYVNGCNTQILELTVKAIPEILSTTPASGCEGNNIFLSATATIGATINWYYIDELFNLVGTGNNFIANNVTTTTTFYVQASLNGCDSELVPVIATINPSSTILTTVSACGSYEWDETEDIYTTSGTYTTISGCNTLVLELTINQPITNTTTITACDSYTWAGNEQTYTDSGTYSYMTACGDEILNLTITPSTTSLTTITECGNYTWPVNQVNYSESGTYTVVNGCDTQILELTINIPVTNTTTITACDSYTWSGNEQTYTTSGIYSYETACGDEVLNLTINTLDNSTSLSNNTITANQVGANYQWINCSTNTPIAEATTQNFTPTESGSYAVIISQNGCTSTSQCVSFELLSTIENEFNSILSVYPNPFNDILTITINNNASIDVYDFVGKLIQIQNISIGTTPINLSNYASGVYLLKVTNEFNQLKTVRIIKR
jgi:hypothetical protein